MFISTSKNQISAFVKVWVSGKKIVCVCLCVCVHVDYFRA